MSEKKVEALELLGKPVAENVKINKETGKPEKIVYSMLKSDLDAIQAEHGLTKEVKAVVTEVNDLVAEAAAKFIATQSIANKCLPVTLKLGSGNGSIEASIAPEKVYSGKKPNTNETYETHKFGTVTMTTNYVFSRELRAEGGVLDQIAKDMEEAMKKRK